MKWNRFIKILINNNSLTQFTWASDILKKYHVVIFIFIHLIFINFNAAEWGDSYRILRAAEHVRENFLAGNLSYPSDEKRLPLFSIVLSVRPDFIEPILFGRIVMFVISILSYLLFVQLFKKLEPRIYENNVLIAFVLFLFNPVLFYWSLRIMADVPFTTIVLGAFLAFYALDFKKNPLLVTALSFLVALVVYTRFEGIILFGAVGLGLLFPDGIHKLSELNPINLIRSGIKEIKNILIYIFSLGIFTIPYFMYFSPFSSSYLKEPSGRVYDINMVLIFVLSLFFMFGITSAVYFFVQKKTELIKFCFKHLGISSFILVSSALILLWPAAVPRLFVSIIPFLIILLVIAINSYFDDSLKRVFENFLEFIKHKIFGEFRLYLRTFAILSGLLLFYILGQYFFRLQHLILYEYVFVLLIFVQILNFYFIVTKNKDLFAVTLFISCFIWTMASATLHKDIHLVITDAAKFASTLDGTLAYNDVSGITNWYFKGNTLYFFDIDIQKFLDRGVKYALITNEHNLGIVFTDKYEKVYDESKVINSRLFRTIVVKIQ